MMFYRNFKLVFIGFVTVFLSACGGGGSGAAQSNVVDISTEKLLDEYIGLTTSAPLTEYDIYPIANYLMSGDISAFLNNSKAKSQFNKMSKSINARATYKESCNGGGAISLVDNTNQTTGIGDLSYIYDQCIEDGIAISGTILYEFFEWDSNWEPTDYRVTYDHLHEEYADGSYFELSGTVDIKGGGNGFCYTSTTSNLLIETETMSVLEKDLASTLKHETFFCDLEDIGQSISGRIYFSEIGYVDIDTPVALIFSDEGELISGELAMSNEQSHISLVTEEASSTVSVDTNNDGTNNFSIVAPSEYFINEAYNEEHIYSVRDNDQDGYLNGVDYYPDNAEVFEPLSVSITDITFNSILGADTSITESFLISGTNIDWSITSTADWLVLSTTTGKGESEITFSIDAAPVGLHQVQLTVLNEVDGTTNIINLNIEIISPILTLSTNSIEFDGTTAAHWDEIMQSVSLSLNTGENSYDITYVLNEPVSHLLQVELAENKVSDDLTNIDLTIDPTVMKAGEYVSTITFTANVLGEEISTTLDVNVLAPKHLLLVPNSGITLSKFVMVDKLSHDIDILDNYELSSTNWTATTTSEWLTVTTSGTTADKLTISANQNINELAADTLYSASVVISSSDLVIENTQIINVGLWIGSSDPLAVTTIDGSYSYIAADRIRPYVYLNNKGDAIEVYNIYNQQLISTISEVGTELGYMEVSADGSTLYVADTADDSIIMIDLDDTSNRSSWKSTDSLEEGFSLSVTNSKALLLSGYGNLYDAQTGLVYLEDVHNGYYGHQYLDVSLFGNRFCTLENNLTPRYIHCYELDFDIERAQASTENIDSYRSSNFDEVAFDVALNNEGTIVYSSGHSFNIGSMDMTVSTIASDATQVVRLKTMEVGTDNVLHGVSDSFDVGEGDKDIWVYENGELSRSESVSDYATAPWRRALAISGDGEITMAIISTPSVAFMSHF